MTPSSIRTDVRILAILGRRALHLQWKPHVRAHSCPALMIATPEYAPPARTCGSGGKTSAVGGQRMHLGSGPRDRVDASGPTARTGAGPLVPPPWHAGHPGGGRAARSGRTR